MKMRGEYPIDENGILHISPYWKKALKLTKKKQTRAYYFWDLFIIFGGFGLLYFIYMRLFG